MILSSRGKARKPSAPDTGGFSSQTRSANPVRQHDRSNVGAGSCAFLTWRILPKDNRTAIGNVQGIVSQLSWHRGFTNPLPTGTASRGLSLGQHSLIIIGKTAPDNTGT